MEFVEVMKRAQEMCNNFPECDKCPIYQSVTTITCWHTLIYEPEKAEAAIIGYFRRKENASK